jgi:Short C-terminal domain
MFGRGKKAKAQNLMATGTRGVGIVADVRDTGMTVNDNPRVKLHFRIEPLDGSAGFDGQKTKTVSRVEIPRAGDRYPIWFDAADHESFAYATIDNEQGKAQIRQLFGTAAETITGIADPTAAAAATDPIEQIRKLDELRTAGILTDAEFEQKKSELLGQV